MTTSRLIGLCMGLGAAVALADPVPVAALDETDMFPFVPSYDAPENVVNMSHLLDAPAAKTRCWALDESGARKAAVPVRDAGGQAEVALDPAYRTVWYELDVR